MNAQKSFVTVKRWLKYVAVTLDLWGGIECSVLTDE